MVQQEGHRASSPEGIPGLRDPRKFSTKGESLYELLEIPKDASPEDIKRAYRRLALKCHPDKNPDDPKSSEKFAEINRANVILTDPKKKEIYDKYGSYGIYVSETVGEDAAMTYLKLNNPCLKCLLVTCFFLTGCCCCLCCCFCCSCCRKQSCEFEDEQLYEMEREDSDNDRNRTNDNNEGGYNYNSQQSNPISSEPIPLGPPQEYS
ncbi:unnamed protein product [Rodentolepis nana]|uniref:J domain-containing protein n=1 Tax=Rodentolepis nana TaxID=102285 RepID=A0A0R3TRI4_RODNA|nr:unnamed protein product [Rodentolepis nana]